MQTGNLNCYHMEQNCLVNCMWLGGKKIYVFEIKTKMEEGRREGREGRKKEAEKD